MKRFSTISVLIAAAATLSACALEDEYDLGEDDQGLYSDPTFYWSGNPVTIPVCWENPNAVPAARREWVRSAIEGSWARYGRVNFAGWSNTACSNGQAGVHIRIVDDRSMAPGGKNLNGVTDGVLLNLSFNTWGPAECRADEAARERCVRSTAMHEFGHVLGFYHEEQRSDYSGPMCGDIPFGNAHPQFYGAYDIDSIMSYCGQVSVADWKTELSPNDIASVQHAYGRRIPGSAVSPRADCLSSHAGAGNGEAAFIWDCDEYADDQEWQRDDGQLSLGNSSCLSSIPWNMRSGTNTVLWNCGPYAYEDWDFEDIQLRGWGGLCLDLENGNTTNWTNIQLWRCDEAVDHNTRWTVTDSGQIKFGDASSNKCLTAYNGQVFIHNCSYPAYQEFDFRAGGEIRLRNTNSCLDAQSLSDASYLAGNGLPGNGTNVQLYQCLSAQLNQKWNFSGHITHARSGLCLDRRNNSNSNGTPTQLYYCNDTDAQIWDYYFK